MYAFRDPEAIRVGRVVDCVSEVQTLNWRLLNVLKRLFLLVEESHFCFQKVFGCRKIKRKQNTTAA